MLWQTQLRADPLPWLLDAAAPGVRYLALRDLCDLAPDDPQLGAARRAAHQAGPISAILEQMNEAGYWAEPGPGYLPKYRGTVWSVLMLAQLGASLTEDVRIERACAYVLDHALAAGGQFSASGSPSGTADCLQGNLCWALLELGCQDPRLETAFDWLARSVTGEGIAPMEDREASVRYYAGKCGPTFACGANNKLPCAWGAVKVMLALGRWPADRRTPAMARAIERGVDFLLGTDPRWPLTPTVTATSPAGTGGSSASRSSTSPTCCKMSRRWSRWATAVIPAWLTRSTSSAKSKTPPAAGCWSTITPARRGPISGRKSSPIRGSRCGRCAP